MIFAHRNGSLKNRLLELQNKVNELTIAQKEYEECAKKLETTTKLANYYMSFSILLHMFCKYMYMHITVC